MRHVVRFAIFAAHLGSTVPRGAVSQQSVSLRKRKKERGGKRKNKKLCNAERVKMESEMGEGKKIKKGGKRRGEGRGRSEELKKIRKNQMQLH